MHNTSVRINYDSYVPLSTESLPVTDLNSANFTARIGHLCALGFVLRHFNPYNVEVGDDFNIPLRNYGELIGSIAEGLYGDLEEIQSQLESATTFAIEEVV